MSSAPELSIIVIGYRMARQLEQTLYTLSTAYQRGVSEADYEVIVVENNSDQMISERQVSSLGKNFRYFKRMEKSCSPVSAVNFGFEQCRSEFVGLMIDGAHMVTPRVIKYVLMSAKAVEHPVVVVPGYHLGEQQQDNNVDCSYDEEAEQRLLGALDWRNNGYRLFDAATFSPANKYSYLHPIMECNCVFASMLSFERIGYCDSSFGLKGGGSVNLHMFRQLGTLPEAEIVVLPGEGSFHQYHGGVSTSQYEDREREIAAHNTQLDSFWGGKFKAVRKEPILMGAVTFWAQKFLQVSSKKYEQRYLRLTKMGRDEWEDSEIPDPAIPALGINEARQNLLNKKR